MMLGDKTALAVEQAEAGATAQFSHHRTGRMRHVSVERRAKEGEAAGYGRLHVGAKAKRSPRHFRHTGKTTVELDRVERTAGATSEFHRRLEHGVLRVALEKPVADQIVAWLLRRRAAPDVNQAIFGDARGARLGKAGDQH